MSERAAEGEVLAEQGILRLESELLGALRRKPSHEAELAGALRELVPFSPRLRDAAVNVLDTLTRRGSFERPLYRACVRSLAEMREARAVAPLARALVCDGAGGLSCLSAAGFSASAALAEPLAKLAASRHPQLALAAEVARILRRESNGAHAVAVAPKIKEAHRIELSGEILFPLSLLPEAPSGLAPALGLLRDSERHLGRWLLLAELGARAGDPVPLVEANERAASGAPAARGAWSLVVWALARDTAEPPSRTTLEVVQRLSDRPASDRDTSFLFRLANARVAAALPVLESLTRAPFPASEQALRAALHLARDYGEPMARRRLAEVAESPRREALRGLAAAALHDAGEIERAQSFVPALSASSRPSSLAWATLLAAAAGGRLQTRLVTEARIRRIERGWVE